MVSTSASGGGTDNKVLGEIRDILKESKKQTWVMIAITIIIAILTMINIFILIKTLIR